MKITFHDSRRVINLPPREEANPAEPQTQPPEAAEPAPASAANDVSSNAAAEAALPEVHSDEAAPSPSSPAATLTASAFLPLLLGLLALAVWLGLQVWQLATDRESLQAAHAAQQPTVDNAAKLRTSLDALAADTQRLADAGNPNAKLLVDELKKRGVTINPQGAPGR